MFDFESTAHRVSIDVFEGPLDLLLFLIKESEVDVYDIPIAKITDQYLSYLNELREHDIDRVGEFLVMAATLVRLKLRLLLAEQLASSDEEADDELDPRLELVERLLEYRRFKDIALRFSDLEREQQDVFYRSKTVLTEEESAPQFLEVTFTDLLGAFQRVLDCMRNEPVHEVEYDELSVEETIAEIRELLDRQSSATLIELIGKRVCRPTIVVTLLAILEMTRTGAIKARQTELHGEIRVFRAADAPPQPQTDELLTTDPTQDPKPQPEQPGTQPAAD